MDMQPTDRSLANVGGHEGVTFTLESPDQQSVAFATIWYCNPDHRLFRVVTKLIAPKASMLATHQHVIDSVHCHASEGRASATQQAQSVFPSFIAPPGYVRDPASTSMLFSGSRGQTIVF